MLRSHWLAPSVGRAHPCTCRTSCVNTAAAGQWMWIETYCTSQSQEAGASRNIRSKNCQFRASSLGKRIAHRWKACLVWRLIDFLKKLFCSIFISAGLLMFYCVLSLCVHLYSNLLEVSLQRHALLKANLSSVTVILCSKQLSLIGIRLYLDWCEITLMSYSD